MAGIEYQLAACVPAPVKALAAPTVPPALEAPADIIEAAVLAEIGAPAPATV